MSKTTVIIGNGIAGITAARYIRKRSDNHIIVISSESKHFYSRTALMYIYMGHMKYEHTKPYEDWFWKKNRIQLVEDFVTEIDIDSCVVKLKAGTAINYDDLIIATGSTSNFPNWPGVQNKGIQGLYSLQDLGLMETQTKGIKKAVVVGGGLIGIEMAEMLHSRGIHVTMIVRESNYWNLVLPENEAKMINREIVKNGIDLRLFTEVKEFRASGAGNVKSVITNLDEEIECEFVGIAVGVSPNIGLLEGSGIQTSRGILVDSNLRTNIPHIYAIGDCAEVQDPTTGRKPTEAVWYAGKIMGETVAQTIAGSPKKYMPGLWYNSAKFFNLEYQVYGQVPVSASDNLDSLYWEDDSGSKALRLVYSTQDSALVGVNSIGIRIRQNIAEEWIENGINIKTVVSNLLKADFNAEFSKKFHGHLVKVYNDNFQDKIEAKKKARALAIFNL